MLINQLGISIIICCYNSAERLPETLEHLAKQKVSAAINWEIIIVDNNSSDDTSKVAEGLWKSFNSNIPFRIIHEPMPGLSNARRAGVKKASFDLIIFCDDDNWLDPNYLELAFQIMEDNPETGVLGGYSNACFESHPPGWFPRFSFAYALGKQLPFSGIANKRRYIAGAGMVVRKAILDSLENISFKNFLSDRKGIALSSGGDTELCLVILFLGYDLRYDERLQFTHYIPSTRLTWNYCLRMLSESYGSMQIYLSFYKLIYQSLSHFRDVTFEQAYAFAYKDAVQAIAKQLRGRNSFRLCKRIILGTEGTMNEIELKGALKRVVYLKNNKQQLRFAFADMKRLIADLRIENQIKHDGFRECFFERKQVSESAEKFTEAI